MKRILKKITAMFLAAGLTCACLPATAMAAEETVSGSFTAAAMNVDGLPQTILGISLNKDGPGSDGTKQISQAIAAKGWDVFSVSEDFNYHTELMSSLGNYTAGKYRGKVSGLTNNTDGLNLIWKNGYTVTGETCVPWEVKYSSGIFNTGNGADHMIDKGYRFYQMTFAEGVTVDFYILHMDADSDPEDIAAREAELQQMVTAIKKSDNHNPIIVMGDTNCRYTREHLETGFIDAINADPRFTIADGWIEKCKNGIYPEYGSASLMVGELGYVDGEIVDKMFYINNTDSDVTLTLDSFKVDTDFNKADDTPLADHYPVVGTFTYEKQAAHTHQYTVETTDPTCTEAGVKTYTCSCGDSYTEENGAALGHDYSAAVTKDPTETEEGVRTYTCTRCDDSYTESIPKLEHVHSYVDAAVPPTCTEQGYTSHICVCGDSYVDTYVEATGHSFQNGQCAVCGTPDPDYVAPEQGGTLGAEVTFEQFTEGRYCIAFMGATERKVLSANGSAVSYVDFETMDAMNLGENLIWTVAATEGGYTLSTNVNGQTMYLAKTTSFTGAGYKVKLQDAPFTWVMGTNGNAGGIRVSWLNSSMRNYYLRYFNSRLGFIGSTSVAGLHFYAVQ
ncbi:MAG: hypothetical protein Q4B85_08500 [Lachnospiraceae bacterium]|nr:hypothetical protein [Lachnospiraceae bacterium]